MKERFEFTDGSFYEFERWTEGELVELTAFSGKLWYMNLLQEFDLDEKIRQEGICNGELITCLVKPSLRVRFRDDYSANLERRKRYKASGSHAAQIIGVGLTFHSYPVRLTSQIVRSELAQGIYLPVKFNYWADSRLYIDPAIITNRVIYEPTVAPKGLERLLTSKT